MSFVVSARKYRPTTFDEVVGQQHVSQTLKKAFQTDHLAHAFLFCGPRGVGKTTCARILAKVLNCQNVGENFEPCGKCDNCLASSANASFNIMELDAASNNSVEHIRSLVEQVRFQPQQGKYKVFIIDEVHMLSQSAFNAFLKTLEEPPPYAVFILATTERHKIIPTILSRCQIFDFKRIQVKEIAAHLQGICNQEGIEAEPDALHTIAQKADGALRDALSIFDRIASFSGKKISYEDVITNLNILDYDYYFRFTDALLTSDLQQVLLIYGDVLRNGFESDLFLNGLAAHLRDLLVCKDKETLRLLDVSDNVRERYQQQAAIAPASFLLTALNIANECDVHFKMARDKNLHVQMALIKMCFIAQAVHLASNGTGAGAEKKTPDLNGAATPAKKTTPRTEPIPESLAPAEQPILPAKKIAEEQPAQANYGPETFDDTPISPPVFKEPEAEVATPQPSASPRLAKMGNLPSLQSLQDLHVEVEEDEAGQGEAVVARLSLDDLQQTWASYIATSEKESVKAILKGAEISISGSDVQVTVGSALAESLIRQERGLMDFLRKKMHAPLLSLRIKLDPTRSNAAPAKPKKLNDSEKFWLMKTANPLVDEVRKRFDLKLENE